MDAELELERRIDLDVPEMRTPELPETGLTMKKCCLCGAPKPTRIERRYTGDFNGTKFQSWRFCETCFQEQIRQARDTDPWITQRYMIFVEYLAGRYERRFDGNQASKVRPRKRASMRRDCAEGVCGVEQC